MTICLKQVDILEGVNILGKQGTHRSKTYNGFTHKKKKENKKKKTRKHKHNTKDNHQTTKRRRTKK